MLMGAGKTKTCTEIIRQWYSSGLPVSVIVRRKSLVNQMSKELREWKIPHGVNMANHYLRDPRKLVQVSSVDTLRARNLCPHVDNKDTLVVIDEWQDASSKTYKDLMDKYAEHKTIGMSGTPFRDNSMFNAIVKPITPEELVSAGVLVPEKVYAPSMIDVSNVKVENGEFNKKELAIASSQITGDVVSHWLKYGEQRPTICFCVSIEHSLNVKEAFESKGISCEHADASTSDEDRNRIIKNIKEGKTKIITNVDIFSVGFDCTELSCVILARPTMSLVWHLQATARGMRAHKGKGNCIVLDHAGNYLRHGFILIDRDATLDKKSNIKAKTGDEVDYKTCSKCYFVFDRGEAICPECGHKNPVKERKIKLEDGELKELHLSDSEKVKIQERAFISDFHKLEWVRKSRGLYQQFTKTQLIKKFGLEVCRKYGKSISLEF